MKAKWKWILTGAAALLLAGFVVRYFGWFSAEPVHGGKTASEWLERVELFSAEQMRTRRGDFSGVSISPEAVANDAAFRALLRIGPPAAPILENKLAEPPVWTARSRLELWLTWCIVNLQTPGGMARPSAPQRFSALERSRRMAAALALLALGTNANGGFTKTAEAWAANSMISPAYQSFNEVEIVCAVAAQALPEQRAELLTGVAAAMNHTNAAVRSISAAIARMFPTGFAEFKPRLVALVADPDPEVARLALHSLVNSGPPDDEVVRLAESVLATQTNTPLLRVTAAMGLALAGRKATNALPALIEASNDPDREVKLTALLAIRKIEEAMRKERD